MFNFLPDDPSCHWIDVEADHVAANAVRLEERCAAAHEWVSDLAAGEIIAGEIEVRKRCISKFGKR